MEKYEFLLVLRETLTGEIPCNAIEDNVDYYDQYICEESKNKPTSEVIKSLGDPRLIAKTIVDTYKMKYGNSNCYENTQTQYESNSNWKDAQYKQRSATQNKYTNQKQDDNNWYVMYNASSKSPWYMKVLNICCFIFILFLILSVGGFALSLFFQIGVPILLIYLIFNFITRIFR